MLGIQRLSSLADIVSLDEGELRLTAEFANDDVTELTVWHPDKKPRDVISVGGQLRVVQERLCHRRLRHRLTPSQFSFGGVRGRGALANASRHSGNTFAFKVDISNFFPSITIDRVNRTFLRELGCSYEVARILTRLCTYDYHLALGLVTSPILADFILRHVDKRIARLSERYGLVYTRFVDDITVSANFDLAGSSVPHAIGQILRDHGFRQNISKIQLGRLDRDITITGVRLKGRRLDVSKAYVERLNAQIADHQSLAADNEFHGPLCTSSQLAGRVYHACWVNRGRRLSLSAV